MLLRSHMAAIIHDGCSKIGVMMMVGAINTSETPVGPPCDGFDLLRKPSIKLLSVQV